MPEISSAVDILKEWVYNTLHQHFDVNKLFARRLLAAIKNNYCKVGL